MTGVWRDDGAQAYRKSASRQGTHLSTPLAVTPSSPTEEMLLTLQSLNWRRIDITWQGASIPHFAHNYIQVTRAVLNMEGAIAVDHLMHVLEQAELAAQEMKLSDGVKS